MDREDIRKLSPEEARTLFRQGLSVPTSGLAEGYAQANLVVLPKKYAYDFLLFCQRNPKPCPVLEVTDPGDPTVKIVADKADIRTDLSLYRVYEHGECVAEVTDIKKYWRDDSVAFLMGCSYSFEYALMKANIRLRHVEEGKTVSLYITNIDCTAAGIFSGPMVVSMRPIPIDKVVRAVQATSRFPATHGSPVHMGDPKKIGVYDLSKPDFGDAFAIGEDDVPVFWACGCTPQAVAMKAKLDFMITHSPGYLFLTDVLSEELAVF